MPLPSSSLAGRHLRRERTVEACSVWMHMIDRMLPLAPSTR